MHEEFDETFAMAAQSTVLDVRRRVHEASGVGLVRLTLHTASWDVLDDAVVLGPGRTTLKLEISLE